LRHISYRSRLRLRTTLIALAIVLAALAVAAVCVFFYLQRYIVYTPEGAKLEFNSDQPPWDLSFDVDRPAPVEGATLVEETEPEEEETSGKLAGFYIDGTMLGDPNAVRESLTSLENSTAVLMDVRSIYGNFYYPSETSGAETSTLVNPNAVRELITTLAGDSRIYLIARLPAFRDSTFALTHQTCGLALPGGALWMDSDGCYWLDPSNDEVIAHLEAAARELSALGFDEIVFDSFYFPASSSIDYDGDGGGEVLEAARRLQANLANDEITVSLGTTDPALAPYAARIYLQESDGSQVQSLAAAFEGAYTPLSDHLVFLTDSRDTRFTAYGLLRPATGGDN